jgi:predicted RNase H-like HicB family nuclease
MCYNISIGGYAMIMKKDVYVYPAIFNYASDGISIEFPDLPGCLTCADTTEEAIKHAKEAMALHLFGMEQDGEEIPEPTPIENIKLNTNDCIVMIEVYMPLMRDAVQCTSVKKTLTIPLWLNKLAEEHNVNFSQVLQTALKDKLNIKN